RVVYGARNALERSTAVPNSQRSLKREVSKTKGGNPMGFATDQSQLEANGLTIMNRSTEAIRIAVYKQSYKLPTLGTLAWRVVAPPVNGQPIVQVPSTFQVFGNYPNQPAEKSDPAAGNQTNIITLAQYTGSFKLVEQSTGDQMQQVIQLAQQFTNLVPQEVNIRNTASIGVWGHITLGGDDVYPPQVIWPGGVMLEDIRPTLYIAIVADYVTQGAVIKEREISDTATAMMPGQVATVTGDKWTGFAIAVS